MKYLPLLLVLTGASLAAEPSILERRIDNVRFEKMPVQAALRTLARATGTTVIIDPDVIGDASLDYRGGPLRGAVAALLGPGGYSFEEGADCVVVRNRKTVLYSIDYPQLTRSGSGSASITLGGANSNGGSQGVITAGTAANGITPYGQNGTDATQVSISQENQNTFWTGLEAELKAMLLPGDGLVLNKFSGVAQVTAPERRQEAVSKFIALVNQRITRQVEIEARIVEVTLNQQRKLGIDWDLAAGSVGNVAVTASANTGVDGVGGTLLANNAFVASLTQGRASAMISALQQQGEVKTVAQPRLRTLNNQTAMIKVGEDRPFFRLQQATSFSSGGNGGAVNQTQEQYAVSTITIGTILAVTPQIDGEGRITLDVLPAITRLQAIVNSPDGKQTAPLTEVKQASTIVRLKDGETAVIGGLISEEAGTQTRGVPVLSSLPVAGKAFQTKATLKNRTELVIFLTPKLVP